MAILTRLETKAYLRSITGVLDSDRINDTTLNADINLSQRKVQLDLLNLGVKQFVKIAYKDQPVYETPSDMLFHPNAIIDLQSTGDAKASLARILEDSKVFSATAIEAGSAIEYSVALEDDGVTTVPIMSYGFTGASIGFRVYFKSGVTTVAQLNALFSNDIVFRNYVVASISGSGAVTESDSTGYSLVDGDGEGWKNAEERGIVEFNRIKNRAFQSGTTVEPVYRRIGDAEASQIIELSPITMKYSKLYYYYRLPDLTSDTESVGLPTEMEELLLIDMQRRIYIYLKKQGEDQSAQLEYQKQINELTKKYDDSLMAIAVDKKRIGLTEASS